MKTKILILAALSLTAMVSADQMNGRSTYQSRPSQQNSSFKQTPRTIMDDEIAKNVHGVIAGNWLSHGYPNVTFDVNNGTVNLRGVVDTQDEKNKVEQAVKKLEGVKAVRSEITVGIQPANKSKMLAINNNKQPAATTAYSDETATTKDSAGTDKDHMINKKIRDKILRWNPKGYETLVFATQNGAVVVTGNIERVEDIQKISNDVKNTEGVKSVTNKVTIKGKSSY